MKGRSLEELDELFENRVAVKEFQKYHTRITEDAMRDIELKKGASPGIFGGKGQAGDQTGVAEKGTGEAAATMDEVERV